MEGVDHSRRFVVFDSFDLRWRVFERYRGVRVICSLLGSLYDEENTCWQRQRVSWLLMEAVHYQRRETTALATTGSRTWLAVDDPPRNQTSQPLAI